MTENETDRTHSIVHDITELYEECMNLGHQPTVAMQLAASAMISYRLEIIATLIDRVDDHMGAMMAINAIDKIKAINITDLMRQAKEETTQ